MKSTVVVKVSVALLVVFLVAGLVLYTSTLTAENARLKRKAFLLSERLEEAERLVERLQEEVSTLTARLSELNDSYQLLEEEYGQLMEEYDSLNLNYSLLQQKYDGLLEDYESLHTNYSSLSRNYTKLREDYKALEGFYNTLKKEYDSLVSNYEAWRSFAWGLIAYFSDDTIAYVFSDEELSYLEGVVEEGIGVYESWTDEVKAIYDYVRWNVMYAYDEPIPLPPYYYEFVSGSYVNETWCNLFMKPSDTLRLGQGDCDDQAILAFGLLETYFKIRYGQYFISWIARIVFADGSAHMAVLIPVEGGELVILDPAGEYLTTNIWGDVDPQDPHYELQRYSDYWSSYGGITSIRLYEVDLIDKRVYVVMEGSLEEVADYIESI